MATTYRRIHKKGVTIQGRYFFSLSLSELIGQLISVDLPEGQLPETLTARCGAQTLTIQAFDPARLCNHFELRDRHIRHCKFQKANIDEPIRNGHSAQAS
jgi:hypothetical protein